MSETRNQQRFYANIHAIAGSVLEIARETSRLIDKIDEVIDLLTERSEHRAGQDEEDAAERTE